MYEIYTDGSCLGNPGRGGWAAISKDFKICGAQPNTTNNIMEMTAILRALEQVRQMNEKSVRIFTDSNYTKQGITSWIHNWKKNGWKTSSGGDVKNRELWIELDKIRDCFIMIEWRWVKAHNGDPKNEEVDKLARECAKNLSV
jgi:ribonuclease HI|tara:strand:- start:73 stop:501 length:429 start_codon:yes stop_codon:yes gene_type:complete